MTTGGRPRHSFEALPPLRRIPRRYSEAQRTTGVEVGGGTRAACTPQSRRDGRNDGMLHQKRGRRCREHPTTPRFRSRLHRSRGPAGDEPTPLPMPRKSTCVAQDDRLDHRRRRSPLSPVQGLGVQPGELLIQELHSPRSPSLGDRILPLDTDHTGRGVHRSAQGGRVTREGGSESSSRSARLSSPETR